MWVDLFPRCKRTNERRSERCHACGVKNPHHAGRDNTLAEGPARNCGLQLDTSIYMSIFRKSTVKVKSRLRNQPVFVDFSRRKKSIYLFEFLNEVEKEDNFGWFKRVGLWTDQRLDGKWFSIIVFKNRCYQSNVFFAQIRTPYIEQTSKLFNAFLNFMTK